MDDLNLEENFCRICLDKDVDLDWNDFLRDQSHLTFKDCYYSFTGLERFDEETLSTMLCRNCSNCLENINIFISKAIETHNLLCEKFCSEVRDDVEKQENFELILVEETDFKQEVQNFDDSSGEPVMESETCSIPDSFKPCAEETEKQGDHCIEEKNSPPKPLPKVAGIPKRKKKKKQIEIPTCCTICSKVLASKYNAIRHEKTHRQNRERNYVCKECGLKFYDKSSLSSHALTHSEDREKNCKCEFCDKSFYSKGALNVHRRIHLGQVIPCPLCGKEYIRQVDLDGHMATHSAAGINGTFIAKKKFFVACEFCGEKIRSVNYKSHIAKHKNVPLFKCSICDTEFFSRDRCDSHLRYFHKKGSGERANLIHRLKTNRCTNLYMQQNSSQVFVEE